MPRKKTYKNNDPFIRSPEIMVGNIKVVRGDIIKIKGIYGTKFKFLEYVINPKNNAEWIDCIQLEKGISCGMRCFRPDRIKLIPKKRGTRVNRTRSSKTS
jgi:hypothetical protein